MSSSRRRDEMAVGVGESPDKVRRMLPLRLMNSSRRLGDRAGPRPVQVEHFLTWVQSGQTYLLI